MAGRPTLYREEYADKAFKLCLMGATDAKLAEFFEVNEDTINEWKKRHPEFSESLKRGKDDADAVIAASLYHRAKGYSHKAVKIFADPKSGAEQIVEYVEQYPPDTTAAIFWLKNRQRANWRDKTEQEVSGTSKIEVVSGIERLPNDPPAD